jgi:hypothetical protein
MAYTAQLLYETLRSIDSSTFTGNYQAIGTPLLYPASIIKLVNNSTSFVTVSVDGINDYDVIPINSFVLYDATSDSPPQGSSGVFVPQGTQYYVKGASGTGDVYLVVQYIKQV